MVNDIKPHVFARNLIVWLLLDDYDVNAENAILIVNTIYFVFCGQIMPTWVWEELQSRIATAIDMLEGRLDLPPWISFPFTVRHVIISVLRTWQSEVPALYSTRRVQREVIDSMNSPLSMHLGADDVEGLNDYVKLEKKCYSKTLALFPEAAATKLHEPELQALIKRYHEVSKSRKKTVIEIGEHVAINWKPNPTFYDLEWEKIEPHIHEVWGTVWNMTDSLFKYTAISKPSNPKRWVDFAAVFFKSAAWALKLLQTRMTIKISIGSIVNELEALRYCQEPASSITKFDRIHLSNIPDYIGTSLFTNVIALPVLKQHDAAFVTTCCLRNIPQFDSIEDYDCEAVVLHKPKDMTKAFNVQHLGTDKHADDGFWPMGDYHMWRRASPELRPYSQLLSRKTTAAWLYGLFFKIALPATRGHNHMGSISEMIMAPVNFSMFLRLLIHLTSVGYPNHWLGAILGDILENRVYTTARAPISSPLRPEEATASHPLQKLSTSSFLAEMTSLVAIFSSVLPFAPIIKVGSVPAPRSVRK